MQNAKLKKQTTLFEWFVSPSLVDITRVLYHIGNITDSGILTEGGGAVFMARSVYSGHYKFDDFLPIYRRRRDRLIELIKNSKRLLFCRVETSVTVYTKDDIDDFVRSIARINPRIQDLKLLLIRPDTCIEHPAVHTVVHSNMEYDPFCKGEDINNMFVKAVHDAGYDVKNTTNETFTDHD
jgi:hypothetical protein